MSSCCRSPSIRSAARGAISRSACSRRPRASARRRASRASSMRCTPPASASSSTGCRRISRATRTGSRASTAPRSTSISIRARASIRTGTRYIYNFGRREVQGFLIASALHWLEHFHVDGLRVDAVASMLYRDYSRKAGEWVPNVYGGRENLEAVGFLRHLNAVVAERCPGAMMIAEEFDRLARRDRSRCREHGLGFSYKWNMGWMHDTLQLHRARSDPPRLPPRRHHLRPALRVLGEVHPAALARRGRARQRARCSARCRATAGRSFANLRAYLGFMWAHPGKKLLFMGGEIAQWHEWNHDAEIDWAPARRPGACRHPAAGARPQPALSRPSPRCIARDAEPDGFRWLIGDDRANSVFAFLRSGRRRRRAGPRRLQHDAGAAARLSHRRAARRAVARDRQHRLRASTAAATSATTARVHTVDQSGARRAALARAHPAAAGDGDAAARGLIDGRLSGPARSRARPIRWARPGTGSAPISRCSPRMPSASSSACSIRPGDAADRAPSRCRNAPTRSGTAICRTRSAGLLYGYRAYGPYEPQHGHRFNPHKLLLDPYARRIAGELRWSDALFGYRVNSPRADLSFDRRDSAPGMLKARRHRRQLQLGATTGRPTCRGPTR